ncbi:MAG: hypothetical protein KKD59_08215, partial [Acidobacteria bacterium]|nr:hypothetical protein [Acidobacteriota bacterium]
MITITAAIPPWIRMERPGTPKRGWILEAKGKNIRSLALLSSLSAFILIGPRVYYAMAKDRI